MQKREIIDEHYLRSFFAFGTDEAADAEIAQINEKLIPMEFSDGQDICKIDDDADGMFFIDVGSAIVLSREGLQINVLHEGQYFGEYAVIARGQRTSTVRAHGRCVVLKLNNDDMREVLDRHPRIYGEMMKKVYDQVSHKHSQLLTLSRMKRGVLQPRKNEPPMSIKQILIQYGSLALVFALTLLLVPNYINIPLFVPPLLLMVVYVLITRRTFEALVISGMMAALLLYRSELIVSYTDSLMATIGNEGNVFTILVMALMGGVASLIEASGAVTAFKRYADSKIKTVKSARLAMIGIMAVTAIDDCLNMLCASTSLRTVNDRLRLPREDSALMLSLLPTCLSAFIPFSLWGIFVVANINTVPGIDGFGLLCRSLLLDFYPILAVIAMLLFCGDKLPRTGMLKQAQKRVSEGGKLWPAGSERYLITEEPDIWGRIQSLIVPVIVLAVSTLGIRSISSRSFMADSACGLVATVVFMFFFYSWRKIMTPDEFTDNLVTGIQGMVLPILLYLLTMCFSSLLEQESIAAFLSDTVLDLGAVSRLMPAVFFLVFTLLTMALGSSWAMYAIAFPLAMRFAQPLGLSLPLCAGAICSAGIAGEKNCPFTSDSLSVGLAIGCDPDKVLKVRLPYSAMISVLSLLLFIVAGYIF
jgi:Na+/H+ antiporter NhaC/CRP-like cAMP-binding protein